MRALEEKILKEGKILKGNIVKVDSFLNHKIDVEFMKEIGEEFARLYKGNGINKILTIEASGIAIAFATAIAMKENVVFAKKSGARNQSDDFYESKVYSYTHQQEYKIRISKEYLDSSDKVLIVDDFLANGEALNGLIDIVNKAGATLVGCGVVIEKGFQNGGKKLREKGVRIESLAIIDEIDEATQIIKFRGE